MTSLYPALRGRFGDTDYYLITMPVSELISKTQLPATVPGWENGSIEERFQRKLDLRRIKRDMAPYFANDPKRFSGSLVLALIDGKMEFETVNRLDQGDMIPIAYRETSQNIGFLTLTNPKLVPLDGQHRVKAFKMALDGYSDPREKFADIPPNDALGSDHVAVIVVNFDQVLSRYIFNKINKYAKPTTSADKLITDDDDSMAVVTRKLIADGVVPGRLVNIESLSLSKKSYEFTTLTSFYKANRLLLGCLPVKVVGKPENMKPKEMDKRRRELVEEWKMLIEGIGEWGKALKDASEKGDARRIKLREKSFACKPTGQLAMVGGYAYACQLLGPEADKDLLIRKLDKIKWEVSNDMWTGVLIKHNGRIMAGLRTAKIASKFVAHLLGAELPPNEKDSLLDRIYGTKRIKKRLPNQVNLGD